MTKSMQNIAKRAGKRLARIRKHLTNRSGEGDLTIKIDVIYLNCKQSRREELEEVGSIIPATRAAERNPSPQNDFEQK